MAGIGKELKGLGMDLVVGFRRGLGGLPTLPKPQQSRGRPKRGKARRRPGPGFGDFSNIGF